MIISHDTNVGYGLLQITGSSCCFALGGCVLHLMLLYSFVCNSEEANIFPMYRLSCWLHLSFLGQRRLLQGGDSQSELERCRSELSCNTQRCSSARHQWCGRTVDSSRDARIHQQFVSVIYVLCIM